MTPRARGAFLAAVMLTFATGAGVAHAANDDPAPYFTVSSTEIVACYTTDPGTLDANVKFEDGTRVNFHPWPYTLTSGCYTFTLPTGHGLPTWVQVHGFNCHIGEDNTGREQNCSWLPTTAPTEEPTWTPEPTPSDEPTSEPSDDVPSTPATPPSDEPTPPSDDETPPTTPSPQPSEQPTTPSAPTTTPSPTSEPPANESPDSTEPTPPTPDPTDTPTTPTPIQPDAPQLAVTGSNDPLVGVAAAALVTLLLGAYLCLTNHRRKP